MLNITSVTLPLDALQQLMILASERRKDFSELIATAIRSMFK